MKAHVLSGDAMLPRFQDSGIEGIIIVSREALIDGPLESEGLVDFWRMRANYIKTAYGEEETRYYAEVAREYEKIFDLAGDDDLFLWFDYDLFCHVNMWFVLSALVQKELKGIYRVFPVTRSGKEIWKGYGDLSAADFQRCFDERVPFKSDDIELARSLWDAYQGGDLQSLERLAKKESACFPYLREVCEAELQRKKNRRPEETLRRLLKSGLTDFNQVFQRFVVEEGVYGFGDVQVRAMYERVKKDEHLSG